MSPIRTPFASNRRRSVIGFPRRVATIACVATLAVVSGASARHDGRTDSYAFGGRIIPADGGQLAGVRVVATDARGTYEAIVDSSGVFVGAFSAPPTGRVTLRVFSDSATPTSARYHTSTVQLGHGVPPAPSRIVLIPTQWRVKGGDFDGRQVSIDPIRAVARSAEGSAGYWRVTNRGRFMGQPVSWATDSLPIRVAFRHERGDPLIAPSDSLAFWTIAQSVERMLGRSLFRPATFAEIDSGADGILVTVNRQMSAAAGKTFITYDQTGRIYEALVTVSRREFLAETRISSHELLHAIGLGHTRAWTSVMGPNTGANDVPSVDDVAYAQLYYAIAELQRQREAPFGILEASAR
jgi:hypothetical protein